ncbi:fibronectin type III domain-containing protein [Sulfurimonas sp.]
MKLWTLTTFLTVLTLTFSGCIGTTPKPNDSDAIDSTLPIVELTQNGVFSDMKEIGFEWNSIKDARVKGIYVFKQTIDKELSEHKHFDTIKSRFVTHYVDRDVKPQTQYSYYFKTFSNDGSESAPSQERIVDTLPILDSVSWIHAIQDMPKSAKIIWRPHPNQIVKSYILERKTLSEDKWDELETIKGRLSAEYIDSDLKDNHVYKYRIRVETYNGITSNPSAEVKVVTKALPKQIENITATKNLPKKIQLTWSATKKVDFMHYNVYRSEDIDGGYDLVISTKTNEYIDDIEEDGKNYFYRVSVIDKDELESTHDVNSIHGQTLPKPTTPSLVGAKMVGNNLEISWKTIDDRVKSHIVTKRVKKGWFASAGEEFVDIKGNTFVDTAIEPKTTYFYTVYSVDEFSIKSEPSIEVKFTTTQDQGKVIEIKENIQPSVDVTKKVVEEGSQNSVQIMDDFDMSVN